MLLSWSQMPHGLSSRASLCICCLFLCEYIDIPIHSPLVGEVEDALSLRPDQFESKYGAKKPSKEDTNIVFHCRAGVRSLSALESAHQMGYSKLVKYLMIFHFPLIWNAVSLATLLILLFAIRSNNATLDLGETGTIFVTSLVISHFFFQG